MQIAIIGLPGSGKTTVFNTLTHGHAETGGFGGLQLHVGVVKVPDERLDRLAEIFHPKKIVHADVTYIDLPAIPASADGRPGAEELPAEHLARLRDADALLHVVRAFESEAHPHPSGSVDARRDLDHVLATPACSFSMKYGSNDTWYLLMSANWRMRSSVVPWCDALWKPTSTPLCG